MNTHILFRPDEDTQDEYEVCQQVWGSKALRFRSQVPSNSLVVARYSALPFYQELEQELALNGSRLINTYDQHRYIADLERWYADLQDVTPRTWFNVGYATVPECPQGWVVKGRTNSRKFQWSTQMYAKDREALREVMYNLYLDTFMREQGLVIREYVPLEKLEEGINGMPITNEWRFFFYQGRMLSKGFYWSIMDPEDFPVSEPEMDAFAQDVANRLVDKAPFVVIDVAKTVEGQWIVIELNDGQMSGLSENDPKVLYRNLIKELDVQYS